MCRLSSCMSALIEGNGFVCLVLILFTSWIGHCDLWDYTIKLEVKLAVECNYTQSDEWNWHLTWLFDGPNQLCCLEGKESQQWRMWTWQGHEGYSENRIRNDEMQQGPPSLCITTPEQKTNQHYGLPHSDSCSGYGDSGPAWIIKQAQCLESASDCMILVPFQRAGTLFFDLLSCDSWTALWHFYSAKGCCCTKDYSYFTETSCQKQID